MPKTLLKSEINDAAMYGVYHVADLGEAYIYLVD